MRRTLPSGLIRFGVGERAASVPDGAPAELFSTGSSGEYQRRSAGGLYFAEERGVAPPDVSSSEFDIRQQSALTFAHKAMMSAGGVFLFWGILLLIRRSDPIAWILVIAGLAMIITPVWRTMTRRRELRAQAERERAEREETERRNREIVGGFAAVLEAFQKDHSPAAAERVRRARDGREIPYNAVAPLAKETVLRIGFGAANRLQELGPAGVAREFNVAIDAVGLNEEDARAVSIHFYQKLLWHLLADDRVSEAQTRTLEELRRALRISDDEIALDRSAVEQFGYLRGLALGALPLVESPVPLKFQEVCHHRSRGELQGPSGRKLSQLGKRFRTLASTWRERIIARFSKRESVMPAEAPSNERYVTVTNRRVVLSNVIETDVLYEELRNIEVDADQRTLTLQTEEDSHVVTIPDAIYTAGVVAIASKTPRKPKGLM